MRGGSSQPPKAFERWELPNVGPVLTGPRSRPIEPLTAGQIESMQREACADVAEESRRAGFAEGYQAGQAQALAEANAKLSRLQALLDHLADPVAAVDRTVEEALVDVAIGVVKHLVRRELRTDRGQIVAAVREAIGAIPTAGRRVRLILHPDDVAIVRGALAPPGQEPGWEIIEDPLVTRGGCRVESGDARIDASVEHRIASLVAQVFGGERQGDE